MSHGLHRAFSGKPWRTFDLRQQVPAMFRAVNNLRLAVDHETHNMRRDCRGLRRGVELYSGEWGWLWWLKDKLGKVGR